MQEVKEKQIPFNESFGYKRLAVCSMISTRASIKMYIIMNDFFDFFYLVVPYFVLCGLISNK